MSNRGKPFWRTTNGRIILGGCGITSVLSFCLIAGLIILASATTPAAPPAEQTVVEAPPAIEAPPPATPTPEPTNTPEPIDTLEPTPTNTLVVQAVIATPTAAAPVTIPPTNAPAPPAPPGPARLVIARVNKEDEYVDIRNTGGQPQDLAGWHLLSETGSQDCPLSGAIGPGQTLRIWAMASDGGRGGFNCGFGSNIWNNSEPDAAVLFDAAGQVVDRR